MSKKKSFAKYSTYTYYIYLITEFKVNIMVKYWVGVASKEHVQRGEKEGFAQVCHGKPGPLRRMKGGDWIVYYSPTYQFGIKNPCQRFTAIGKIDEREPYQFAMTEQFIPWRRDVDFLPSRSAAIDSLLENLSFIKDKKRWGFPFRRGCFEISQDDFKKIANEMGVECV